MKFFEDSSEDKLLKHADDDVSAMLQVYLQAVLHLTFPYQEPSQIYHENPTQPLSTDRKRSIAFFRLVFWPRTSLASL